MTKKDIQLLLEYDAWADLKTLETVLPLADEQFRKDVKSSFGGIHGTLVHILSADGVWLARWQGKTPAPLKAEDFPAAAALKKPWDAYHMELKNYFLSVPEETLNANLAYKDFKGNVHSQLLCLQLQHKVNHSTYHRGQIASMLRMMDIKPASTDFINYLRLLENHG